MGLRDKEQCDVNELTKTAYNLLDSGDNEKAIEYFENAAVKARELGNTSAIVPCYLNAGACLVIQGEFRRGRRFLQSALKLLRGKRSSRSELEGQISWSDDYRHLTSSSRSAKTSGVIAKDAAVRMSADIHHYLGVAHQGMEDYQKARAHLQMSVKLYMKDPSSSGHAAESLTHLSHCYRDMEDVEKEMSSLKGAEELYHELGDSSNEAGTCMELGRLYLREGRADDTKQMLSTARMLCQRVDNDADGGKLYCELGLLYIAIGLFDPAMESFERALPLVRKGRRTSKSLQAEASILQNIGAVYNEKDMFLEAVAYHKEAAAIHGQLGNHNSESKCLCNLASAEIQLDRLEKASVTFSNALAAAHRAGNTYLQFQACEGLGSIQLQWRRHGNAVGHFEQALGLLDHIKEDSGIPRERIMEKLSTAFELLEQKTGPIKKEEEEEVVSEKRESSESNDSEMELEYVERDVDEKEVVGSLHTKKVTRSLGPEFSAAARSPSNGKRSSRMPTLKTVERNRKELRVPLRERRGVGGKLPPLQPLQTIHKGGESHSPHTPASHLSKRGKEKLQRQPSNGDSDSTFYKEQLEYMDSYRHSSEDDDNFETSPSPVGIPGSSTQGSIVNEGSLAIGANAREKFKVRTVQEEGAKGKGKGAKGHRRQRIRSEIVSTSESPGAASTTSPEQAGGNRGAQAKTTTQQQSKVCTIL